MVSTLAISVQIIIAATSIYALVTSIRSLLVSRRAFEEENRPYVTFNIENELEGKIIFFFVRNTGIRGAHNVKIRIKPAPKSYALADNPRHKDRDEYCFTFLAPNQTIRTFFDHMTHRYPEGKKPDIEVFDVSITYSYGDREFKDEYVCDTSYIYHIVRPSTSSELSESLKTIHEDCERIAEAIERKN